LASEGDLLGASATQDDDLEPYAELEKPSQIQGPAGVAATGQLLDLSKMLETKKKQQDEKKKRVEALLEKERRLVMYNPVVAKEFVDDRLKEIENYKNKISQEKYF